MTYSASRRHFLCASAAGVGGALLGTAFLGERDVSSNPQEHPRAAWKKEAGKPVIALHGGYTTGLHEDPELVKARQDTLAYIIMHAEDYLLGRADGKTHTAAETAQYAVELLEQSQIFNSGLGANFQGDGDVRRTAALHDGATKTWGSVEGVPGILNPIVFASHLRELAMAQPEESRTECSNTRLSGSLAAEWALRNRGDMPRLKFGNIAVQKRFDALLQRAYDQGVQGSKASDPPTSNGTVGCVVMDADGNFAAATSTGGTSNNVPGRVGDSGTSAGTFADERGAASMTGSGEGIVGLSMASGLVQALDFTSVDGAARHMFEKAFRHHVSCAAIFIGKGEGDDSVQVRCTDADAVMPFAWSRGDGTIHVFQINPGTYYDDAPGEAARTARQLADAGLSDAYKGFGKRELIGAQRDSFDIVLTPAKRAELEAAMAAVKSAPANALVPILPPQPVSGIPVSPDAVDVKAEMVKATAAGRAGLPLPRP